MGGEIGVTSEPGGDSVFSFTCELPQAPENRGGIPAWSNSTALDGRPLRILLAEDNRVDQPIASATLRRLGHVVDVVLDGLEAVRAFEAQAYELILMDCHMSALDELAATRDIRGLGVRGRQVPIIALTADLFAIGRDHCRAAGMNDDFTKPFETEPVQEVSSRLTRAARGG